MTIAQVYAIIALLLAFGTPQTTVSDVQGILLSRYAPTTQSAMSPVATGGSVDTSYVPPAVNITNGSPVNPALVAQQLLIVNNSINVLKVQATTNQPVKTFSVVEYPTGKELYSLDAILIHTYTGSYQYNSAYLSSGIPDETRFTIIATTESGAMVTSRIYEAFYLTTPECEQYDKNFGSRLNCSLTFVRIAPADAD